MELIAMLSTGKGTWGQVAGLMKKGEWEKIIILGPSYAVDFKVEGIPFDFIEYDPNKSLIKLKNEFATKLKPKIKGLEVALSIASGSGKEHMALQSALLSLPVGVRFTALTKEGVVFLWMRFFEDFLIYPTDFGLTLEVILGGGWREAAKRFPVDRLSESMGLVVQISQKMLDGAGMSQKIELRSGELGLQGISLNPGRCGIDLEPAQYKYISHNLTKSIQVLALLPLLIRYIRDLEHFKP